MVLASVTPLKLCLSCQEQLAVLKARGLQVPDESVALDALTRISYYRLSGYWYPFRETNPRGTKGRQDDFQLGTSMDVLLGLYEFDRQLRLLVLDAVERIEVAIRVDISSRLGRKHRLAHECPKLLDKNFTSVIVDLRSGKTAYEVWLAKLDVALSKAKDDFVKHHERVYYGKMPIWVSIELWELGLLSKFFAGMQYADQTYIARKYGLSQGHEMATWLRAINLVRNISAHHGRLWNKNIADRPKLPASQPHNFLYHLVQDVRAQTRVYGTLCLIQLMMRKISPQGEWSVRLKELCLRFPESRVVALRDAGFVDGWQDLPLWN